MIDRDEIKNMTNEEMIDKFFEIFSGLPRERQELLIAIMQYGSDQILEELSSEFDQDDQD